MKKHIILPITLAAMMMLGGCNNSTTTTTPTTPSTEPTSTEPGPSSVVAESVTITNKDVLTAEWHVGDATRKIVIEANPEFENINDCLDNGSLTITSSNAEIVSVTRLMLTPKAVGKATITVNYGGKSDSVEITVSGELTAIEKYGTVHAGTAEDPFDNADAVKAAPLAKEASDTTKYYIKGIVHSFYHTPGERTDGVVSWYIKDAEGNKGFECYKILHEDGSFLTDDDIWIGAEVIAKGTLTVYNGQAETDTGIFVENTGKGASKPEARKTITATVAEAVAAGKALEDGASTWDYYKVTGYVAIAEGTNVWIADEKGSTAGKTDLLQLYLQYFTGKVLDPENNETTVEKGLTLNAKVEATMIIKNYHEQVENAIIKGDIKILEAGQEAPVGPTEAPYAETPAVATDYIVGLWQEGLSKQLLLTGVKSGNYLTTTEDKQETSTFVVEQVEGGYNLRVKEGVYLNLRSKVSNEKTYYNAYLEDTATKTPTVYTWNAVAHTFVTVCEDGVTAFLGTNYTNTNVGGYDIANLIKDGALIAGAKYYPIHLYAATDLNPYEPAYATSIASNRKYNAGVCRGTQKDTLYATGEVSGGYLSTSLHIAEGAEFIFEEVEGGFNLRVVDGNYINVVVDGDKYKAAAEATASSVWVWNQAANTLTTTASNGTEVYIGSYSKSTYTTLSVSETSYLFNKATNTVKDGQYPLHFYDAGLNAPQETLETTTGFSGHLNADSTVATFTSTSATVTVEKGSGNNFRSNSENIRCYKGTNLKIAPNEGYTLLLVIVTCENASYATTLAGQTFKNGSVATASDTTVEITIGTDGAVAFDKASEQYRVVSFTFYYSVNA